jgi:GT2 family glycosyltransferase
MTPSLDVIIVNWNSDRLLSRCIRSIDVAFQKSFKLNRVVVIDNASSDGSIDCIKHTNLPLIIIRNTQNLGFAKACNQGAEKSNADFLLFLNPDTQLFNNSLSEPISFFTQEKNKDVGIVGIQLIDDQRKISKTSSRFLTPYRAIYLSLGFDRLFPKFFHGHFIEDLESKSSKEVDQVMGAFFLVRKTVFDQLNGFDEKFFVYFEDLDFAFRARKIGYKSYYLSNIQAYHKGGGTSEKVKADRLSYLLESKLLFIQKHYSTNSYLLVLFATLVIEPFVRIIFAITQRSLDDAREVIKGYKKLVYRFVSKHK